MNGGGRSPTFASAAARGVRLPFSGRGRTRPRQPETLQRRGGGSARLGKRLDRGGLRPVRGTPAYWRNLVPHLTQRAGLQPGGRRTASEDRVNVWLLVLSAKRIPHQFFPAKGGAPRLYVPPLHEAGALHEILAVEAERPTPVFVPPSRDNVWGVLFFLALLLLWHGFRWQWFRVEPFTPPFPETPRAWAAAFGLDVYRFRSLHEFWRAVTALTLHADDAHLFSNLGFGLLFFIPLCRRAGLGMGIGLAVLAGICGNACNALTRAPYVLSLGFSTALFGGVGALCALNGADIVRHQRRFAAFGAQPGRAGGPSFIRAAARRLLLPLAAGLALLGLLGGGGEVRTDYPAHIWGFCWGLLVTLAALPLEQRLFSLPPDAQQRVQAALFCAVPLLFTLVWLYALS